MRTVTFDNILRGICDELGWDADNLDADEFGRIKRAVSGALETVHRSTWWSDLVQTEQIQYEATWSSSTAYVVGDFVYYTPTSTYYQCIRAHTGQTPDTGAGTDYAYWIEAQLDWDSDDYDAAATYAPGEVVLHTNGSYYACHTSSTGNAPTDTSYWGEAFPWIPTFPFTDSTKVAIGDVEGLYKADPRVYRFADRISFERTPDGITPLQTALTAKPWIRYLPIPHVFDGDTWSATRVYIPVWDGERSAT